MGRLKLYRSVCGIFPPIISQSIRNRIFPLDKARRLKLDFSNVSITGSTFYGNSSDDHSYRFAIHGFFDWRNIIIAKRFTEYYKGDIIELGANVGTETISYCDIVATKWKVHAFEPLPENIKELENLKQRMQNLILYPYAISNKTAEVLFQIPPIHESGMGKIIKEETNRRPDETLMVKSFPLDYYTDHFEAVSLISIDIEGHEPFALEGSEEILKKFRPAVIIEVSPKLLKKHSNATSDNIFEFFNDLNYHCFTIGRYTLGNIDETALQTRKSVNWFCIPIEKKKVVKEIKNDLMLRAIVPWYFLKSLK